MAGVKSAARTLELLELVSTHPEGVTFSAVQQQLDLPKSSAFGLLQQLVDAGYLIYEPVSRRYEPGWEFLRLASRFISGSDLLSELSALTRTVTRELGMTSHAAILDGTDVVYLAKAEAGAQVSLMTRTGLKLPAQCTAVGKVLLSGLGDDEVVGRFQDLPWTQLTSHSLPSLDALLVELDVTRRLGFAREEQESSEYAGCLAIPLRQGSAVVAALSVTMPIADFRDVDEAAVAARLQAIRAVFDGRALRHATVEE